MNAGGNYIHECQNHFEYLFEIKNELFKLKQYENEISIYEGFCSLEDQTVLGSRNGFLIVYKFGDTELKYAFQAKEAIHIINMTEGIRCLKSRKLSTFDLKIELYNLALKMLLEYFSKNTKDFVKYVQYLVSVGNKIGRKELKKEFRDLIKE